MDHNKVMKKLIFRVVRRLQKKGTPNEEIANEILSMLLNHTTYFFLLIADVNKWDRELLVNKLNGLTKQFTHRTIEGFDTVQEKKNV